MIESSELPKPSASPPRNWTRKYVHYWTRRCVGVDVYDSRGQLLCQTRVHVERQGLSLVLEGLEGTAEYAGKILDRMTSFLVSDRN